jgi:putative transposase
MIVSMPTTARPQQRYDHRLRDLVQRTGDVTVATDLGVPRSTARGWLGAAPTVVVCLDGLRMTRANEMWHIDTTVIRLLDGTRAYLHAVIDNFSRRILAWRVADTFAPVNSVSGLLDASRAAASSDTTPVVLADAGVENVNAQVDALIHTGVLRRLLAFTELKFSNSMIEAWWRSLKHQWLFLHSLDSVTTVRRLVAFYVDEHTTACFHIRRFADRRLTRCTLEQGDAMLADLTSRAAAARRARVDANRSASCATCPSVDAAA